MIFSLILAVLVTNNAYAVEFFPLVSTNIDWAKTQQGFIGKPIIFQLTTTNDNFEPLDFNLLFTTRLPDDTIVDNKTIPVHLNPNETKTVTYQFVPIKAGNFITGVSSEVYPLGESITFSVLDASKNYKTETIVIHTIPSQKSCSRVCLNQSETTVNVGTIVEWLNESPNTQTIQTGIYKEDANGISFSADNRLVGKIEPESKFPFLFLESGDYKYYFSDHRFLQYAGIIHVLPENQDLDRSNMLLYEDWSTFLIRGFDDSVPPTADKTFKIEYSDLVQAINTTSDEILDFWGFDIKLKQNSSGIFDFKIPKNFPTPASFTGIWYHNDGKPFVLADGFEIGYDTIEDPCYFHYRMQVENYTNIEILYSVILTGTWQLYSPIQFNETDQCYNKVFHTSSIIPSYKPQIKITPSTPVRYGDSFTIHAWLDSYEKPDELRYAIDVFDENGRQVDSTLWFARQDFVYEFDTTHPAYNITKGGPYLIKIEKTNGMERTGIIEATLHFEIIKLDIIPPESHFVTLSSSNNYVPIIVLMIAGIGGGICLVVIFLILRKRK